MRLLNLLHPLRAFRLLRRPPSASPFKMAYFFSADASASRPPFGHDTEFAFTQPPHPSWKPGQEQPFPYADESETFFDSEKTPMQVRYGLMSGFTPTTQFNQPTDLN